MPTAPPQPTEPLTAEQATKAYEVAGDAVPWCADGKARSALLLARERHAAGLLAVAHEATKREREACAQLVADAHAANFVLAAAIRARGGAK